MPLSEPTYRIVIKREIAAAGLQRTTRKCNSLLNQIAAEDEFKSQNGSCRLAGLASQR